MAIIDKIRSLISESSTEYVLKDNSGTQSSHTHSKDQITDLPNIPEAANNGTLTIQKNGTTVAQFGADSASDVTANISVPTALSELSTDTTHRVVTDIEKSTWNNKAPTNHASTETTYGVGDATNYGHVKVDSALSTTSTNPVQNKVVKDALDLKEHRYLAEIRKSNLVTDNITLKTRLRKEQGSSMFLVKFLGDSYEKGVIDIDVSINTYSETSRFEKQVNLGSWAPTIYFWGYKDSEESTEEYIAISLVGSIQWPSIKAYYYYGNKSTGASTNGWTFVENAEIPESAHLIPDNGVSIANKLKTARTIQTNLGSTSSASFDGSVNVTPGVTGTLPIANGGTGATTAANARTNLDVYSKSESDDFRNLVCGTPGYASDSLAEPDLYIQKLAIGGMGVHNKGITLKAYTFVGNDEANAILVFDSTALTGTDKDYFEKGIKRTYFTTNFGESIKFVWTGDINHYFRALGLYINSHAGSGVDNDHQINARFEIGGSSYETFGMSSWGSYFTFVFHGSQISANIYLVPVKPTNKMTFSGARSLTTYGESDKVLNGTSLYTYALNASRNLKVDLALESAQSFDGSANAESIGVSNTLPITHGGTGKTNANDAANALINGLPLWSADVTDSTQIIRQDNAGAATFGRVPGSAMWNYIKGKVKTWLGIGTDDVLPITHGGTGATTAANARTNLGLGNVENESVSDGTPDFTEATTRTNIDSGETMSTIFGKIKKWFTDLKTVAFTGSYNDLIDKPTLPTGQVQSDWNEAGTSEPSFIKNKPQNLVHDANYVHTDNNYTTTEKTKLSGIASGAEVNVQADWTETNTASDAYIKNKPTIPPAITVDSALSSTSTNPVQNKVVTTALDGKAAVINRNSIWMWDSTFASSNCGAGQYSIHNAFYSLHKRGYETSIICKKDGSADIDYSSYASELYDGSFDNYSIKCISGSTTTIRIIRNGGGAGTNKFIQPAGGYFYGKFILCFYAWWPESVSIRVYRDYPSQATPGWVNLAVNKASEGYFFHANNDWYNISEIEITIVAGNHTNNYPGVSELAFIASRPQGSDWAPYVRKYGKETLYDDLEAPHFVGKLTGEFTTARNLKVNLASESAQSFDGSSDATSIGVSGTLPIVNGGTGATTADAARANLDVYSKGEVNTALSAAIADEATTRASADTALGGRIDSEESDRQQADRDLQAQIDAISSRSDVVNVVASYVELLAYDTSTLFDNDVIKVLQDETHYDAESYYRWNATTETWGYIGSQGPFVTPAEMQNALNDKVDKVTGKGLSTNDYTDAEKTKLGDIEAGANKTIVDSALSGTSTNPVQNKVVMEELGGKIDKSGGKMTGPLLGYFTSSRETVIGNEYNVLLNAKNRGVTFTQSGSGQLNDSSVWGLFDGNIDPKYSITSIDPTNPYVLEIDVVSLIGDTHCQVFSAFGWTCRYWEPIRFKVELYDTYRSVNEWVTICDYSQTNFSGQYSGGSSANLFVKFGAGTINPHTGAIRGGTFSKIRITIYKGNEESNRWGISEIFFWYPEAQRVFQGIAAFSATRLETARNLKVNLASESAQSFDGSTNAESIGVSGTLSITHGGTGAANAPAARTNLDVYSKGEVDSAVSSKADANGSNATGTWDIAITKNAATASSAGSISIEEIGTTTEVDLDNYTANDGLVHFYAWSNSNKGKVANKPTDDPYTIEVLPVSAGGRGQFVIQKAYKRGTDEIYVRRRSDSTITRWTSWKRIVYGDGSNATGTWSVNISGNAATAKCPERASYYLTDDQWHKLVTIQSSLTDSFTHLGIVLNIASSNYGNVREGNNACAVGKLFVFQRRNYSSVIENYSKRKEYVEFSSSEAAQGLTFGYEGAVVNDKLTLRIFVRNVGSLTNVHCFATVENIACATTDSPSVTLHTTGDLRTEGATMIACTNKAVMLRDI